MDADRAPAPELPEVLLRPEAYPHPADDLRLHETHISWVILAGPYGYKVKKPVNLGFLDFSDVERRAADCADEVRLNRRLCPDVYLGVCWLVERDDALSVGGDGRPVEPMVQMRRLPADGMLPHLLHNGAADADLARRIGHHLARFHASAATGPGVDQYGP
jgi:aminoglycoside phosphotransferase family enzyme